MFKSAAFLGKKEPSNQVVKPEGHSGRIHQVCGQPLPKCHNRKDRSQSLQCSAIQGVVKSLSVDLPGKALLLHEDVAPAPLGCDICAQVAKKFPICIASGHLVRQDTGSFIQLLICIKQFLV